MFLELPLFHTGSYTQLFPKFQLLPLQVLVYRQFSMLPEVLLFPEFELLVSGVSSISTERISSAV